MGAKGSFYSNLAGLLSRSNKIFKKARNMNRFFKQLFILPIRFYQKAISPLLGSNCRFQPTCSQYMVLAIEEWGPIRGVWLGLKRISKCHPWGPHGHDPVPKKNSCCGKD
ncbi:MAG: membrane protein insertion efficiency factor YidD [Bacteroidota bacterium]